ncbi:MAG: hypothetical protein M1127_00415 [Patescibacteria group bacterium]|nr:hypothetical protein [Patescibacteria group bacterium]
MSSNRTGIIAFFVLGVFLFFLVGLYLVQIENLTEIGYRLEAYQSQPRNISGNTNQNKLSLEQLEQQAQTMELAKVIEVKYIDSAGEPIAKAK